MKLFTDEYINTGRQIELDWARGLAVFFMILVHVKICMRPYPLLDLYAKIIEFCGNPPAAPTFMILLGAGIVYSKNRDPKKLSIRGLKLLLANYVLNFISLGLPYLTLFFQTNDAANLELMIFETIGADILAFAGLTFLFFALVEKMRIKLIHVILVTLVLSCLNYLVSAAFININISVLPGLLIRVNENSYFPFLSWIGYPVMGYVFGNFLMRCSRKKAFYRYLFMFSALSALAISLASQKYDFDIWSMHFVGTGEYYYQDFVQYILVGGICFSWICILYVLSGINALRFLGKLLSRWSKNVTVMYFAHLIIIGWFSVLEIINFTVDPLVNFATGIVIVILSDAAAVWYIKAAAFVRR
jgi:uncharacterized membrane protein